MSMTWRINTITSQMIHPMSLTRMLTGILGSSTHTNTCPTSTTSIGIPDFILSDFVPGANSGSPTGVAGIDCVSVFGVSYGLVPWIEGFEVAVRYAPRLATSGHHLHDGSCSGIYPARVFCCNVRGRHWRRQSLLPWLCVKARPWRRHRA